MNTKHNSYKSKKALRIGSVVRSYFKNNSADDIIIDLWYYVALTPLSIVENKKKWVRIAILPILFPWAAFFLVATLPIVLILLIVLLVEII
jgi:hypothetical protein